jgi:uncharacterized protein YqfA (UPF0365 family)
LPCRARSAGSRSACSSGGTGSSGWRAGKNCCSCRSECCSEHISKNILDRGLDAGTAYEILSIDIADVDVGENIGAKLQIDQANADKQIAQAKAEERRAMAVALEQEMQARVVEAEAEVPRAMAEAFRQGNLGIMDFYRMKNIQADSPMRESIAEDDSDDPASRRR